MAWTTRKHEEERALTLHALVWISGRSEREAIGTTREAELSRAPSRRPYPTLPSRCPQAATKRPWVLRGGPHSTSSRPRERTSEGVDELTTGSLVGSWSDLTRRAGALQVLQLQQHGGARRPHASLQPGGGARGKCEQEARKAPTRRQNRRDELAGTRH